MSNVLATLIESANALNAYDQVFQVVQNNVANANTPGYARQSLQLEAQAFEPPGLQGGVTAGTVQSSRNQFAEQAVRQTTTGLGQQQQLENSLNSLQSLFDISGTTGIDYALNNFFQSASAWAQSPSDQVARQQVIEQATNVAEAFQQTSASLAQFSQQNQSQIQSTAQQVNQIVGQLQKYNQQIMSEPDAAQDAGMDANVNAALQNLSSLVSFTATQQSNGTTTILLNGQTPLLIGANQYTISAGTVSPPSPPAAYSGAPPDAQLLSSSGADITAQTTGGQLGALLQISNTVLPSIQGDANQAGSLNTMAQNFADTVNQLLTSGNISDGPPPVTGVPLFTYTNTNADGSSNPTLVAGSIAVDPTVTPNDLAAISPGPPEVSNGVALDLAQLANPTTSTGEINGFSYSQYYGNIAASVGNQLQQAQNGVQVQQSLQSQAENQRQLVSGVDINTEAMTAVEFQRAYEANSQLITVLDQITEDTINMMTQAG